ncbi:hypothetical protein BJX64DRAFT_273476 [Aspergillus heterothallicus]
MASPKTPILNSGTREVSELISAAYRSLNICLGKSRLNSYARLPAFIGLAIVREAWATTISRISNATRSFTFNIHYLDDWVTVVQVKLDPGSPPITPPASPGTTLRSTLLKQTSIVYIDSVDHNRVERYDLGSRLNVRQSNIRLEAIQHARRWHMTLWYNPETVSAVQGEELIELFQQNLEVVLQSLTVVLPPSPSTELDETPRLSDDNVVDLDQLSDCPTIDRCIHDLIEEQVSLRPQQEAVCAHDGSLSYAKLSALSSTLSHKLRQLGACPEQRVVILMSKSRWYSVSVLGTLKAGAAFVPLDPSHPDNRLRQLAEDIEPCALITTASLSSKAHTLGCSNVLVIDDADLEAPLEQQPKASVIPSNAAYVIFTSGSTGKPKGVVIEHSALATSAVMRGPVLGLGPDSRVLQYAPHTFDVSVDEILTTWIHGGCVCVPSENDRFMIAEFMEAAGVTAALLTPTSARTLSPDDVPTLRTLQTGGEVLTEDVNDKWSNRVTLFNVYGPTEASVACIISNRTGLQGAGHALGSAVGGKCWVVDPEDISQKLCSGEIGELLITGPILARGYFRDPARTDSSFIRLATGERVYKTGDLASIDADGVISYHGRKDLEIKIRGQRINIAEVEHSILQCDIVHSAVVEYPRSGPCARRLISVVCLNESTDSRQDSGELFAAARPLSDENIMVLLDHVSRVLTAAMVPSKWISLPYLPQTTSTKVDRKKVRTWLEHMDEGTCNRLFHTAPDTIQRGIGDPSLDPYGLGALWGKSFIRNGGDSIMAMEARTLSHRAGSLHDIGLKATSSPTLSLASSMEEDTDQPFALSPDPILGLQQRVSVEITQHIHADHLRVALDYLVEQHQMLAARFVLSASGWTHPLNDFCTEPMSIEHGPLLVLCAHHLVVDFVSWRQGTAPQPRMGHTLTFQQWSREQAKYASTLTPDIALPYQPGPVDLSFWQIPGVVHHSFHLSTVHTAKFLDKFNNPPSFHPADVILGTFSVAFELGWFTAAYPIHLPSKRRQATPANGHAYWTCRHLSSQVVFNYAGSVVQSTSGQSLFAVGVHTSEPEQKLDVTRVHELMHTHSQLLLSAIGGTKEDAQPSWARSCPADITRLLSEQAIDVERDIEMAIEPWYYRVLDIDRLVQAWHEFSETLQQFIAIVLSKVNPIVVHTRASDKTNTRSLCKDAELLSPPHRMVLHELGDGTVECQLEFSHVIIDAASRSIVLQHLADAYEGKRQRQSLEPPSYWEYLDIIQSSTDQYDFTPIPTKALKPAGTVATIPFELSDADNSILGTCKANEITISSFFMAAWCIALSQHLENQNVSFDYVLSDRSIALPGVESAVGPFFRLPACQMAVSPNLPVVEFAREVHAQRTGVAKRGLSVPSQSTAMQGLRTLVNIRNSGTDSLDMNAGGVRWSLRCFDDPWDYDLVFAVNVHGSKVLGYSIEYTENVVSVSLASGFAKSITRIVGAAM